MVIFFKGLGGLVVGLIIISVCVSILCLRYVNPAIILTLGVVFCLAIQGLAIFRRDRLWDDTIMFIPLPVWSVLIVVGYFNLMFAVNFWRDASYGSKESVSKVLKVVENIRFPIQMKNENGSTY